MAELTPPPIPEALCGVKRMQDGLIVSGGCTFTKGHAELQDEPQHTWEKGGQS